MMKLISLLWIFLLFAVTAEAQVQVLISYHSESGNTRMMAEFVANGARSVDGVVVHLKTTEETTEKDLINADAIILGSPVYNANVTPEISRFIASWPFEGAPLKDKIGAAFVTAGGISAGEELVQMNILQSMLVFGMIIVGGLDWTHPFGASAITAEGPFEVGNKIGIDQTFLERARDLGERVAEITLKLEKD
ncbi:MAG: flavodoxin family protein [Balneolaceae bacterium]